MKAVCDEPLKKDGFGEYKLTPESLDDLWHLSHLISLGDIVYAVTLRTADTPSDKIRAEKAEKRPVRIGLKVEKSEFSSDASRLRVFGVIVFGPDIGQHHTLNLETGYEISVVKVWKAIDLERIERAVNASVHGVVHIIAIEDGEAEIYRIRQYGPEKIASLTIGSGKTAGLDSRQSLFAECLKYLENTTNYIVAAGPGFVKDDFIQYVKNKSPDTADRIIAADTKRSGYGAVTEAIGSGVLNRIAEDIQLSREVSFIDELFLRIGQNGAASYGLDDTMKSIDYGAAETVLVLDILIRDEKISKVIESAEAGRAKVVVFSSNFEPGKRLEGIGGIAALLRYKIQ